MSGVVVRGTQSPEKTGSGRRPSSLRDRIDLREIMQDEVHEFCRLRRQELWEELTKAHPEWDQEQVQKEVDRRQPEYGEYDPVVGMAIIAADHRNSVDVRLAAHKGAAEYVRPKLKSVEVKLGESDPEAQEKRREMMSRLADLLDAASGAKRATVIDATARPSPPSRSADDEQPDGPGEEQDAED